MNKLFLNMVPIEVANMILLHIPLQYRATSYYNWKMITPIITSMYNLSVNDIVKNTTMSAILLIKNNLPNNDAEFDIRLLNNIIMYNCIELFKYVQYDKSIIYLQSGACVPNLAIAKLVRSTIISSYYRKTDNTEVYKYYMRTIYNDTRSGFTHDSMLNNIHDISTIKFIFSKYKLITTSSLYNNISHNIFDIIKYYHYVNNYNISQSVLHHINLCSTIVQKFAYSLLSKPPKWIDVINYTMCSTDTDSYKLLHIQPYFRKYIYYQKHPFTPHSVYCCKLIYALNNNISTIYPINIDICKYVYIYFDEYMVIDRLYNCQYIKLLLMKNNISTLAFSTSYLYDIDVYKMMHYHNIYIYSDVFSMAADANNYKICKFLYSIQHTSNELANTALDATALNMWNKLSLSTAKTE